MEEKQVASTPDAATAPGRSSSDVVPSRLSSALAGLAGLNVPAPRARPAPSVSPRPLHFSKEQEAFLASSGPRLLLSALAGCGKTTTLFEYARRRPHQRWRLLVLNRSLATALAKTAPANVAVSTLHKMAYAAQGHLLSSKLVPGDLPLPALAAWQPRSATGFVQALRVGLEQFCMSADPVPSEAHAPLAWRLGEYWDPQEWTNALRSLWAACLDPSSSMPATHSVYLKRFCQQEHVWMGERWMLDEAQDWPSSVLDAFRRCARVSIRAGDPCQRLYAFRGANLGQWHDPACEKEFRLTQSWRSSQVLAPWINACLDRLPGKWHWEGRPDMECSIDLRAGPSTPELIHHFSPDAILADRWDTLDGIAASLNGLRGVHWPQDSRRPSLPGPSPSILCSTIHGAKGLEFDRLWLPDGHVRPGLTPAQSARLWYVSISRARQALSLQEGAMIPLSLPSSALSEVFEDDPGMDWIS